MIQTERYTLYNGDAVKTMMEEIGAGSVDAIICDPPYGTTACSWDTVIPFEPMWEAIKRVLKPRGAVVLFGSQPFTSALVMSNPGWFKYSWVWDKANVSNPQLAKYMPLKHHEDIPVFGNGTITYNPQGLEKTKIIRVADSAMGQLKHLANSKAYIQEWTNYPKLFLPFPIERDALHPTQKPVALMEYLIRTYTNKGDTVLDFTCGSGSTGVAAVKNGRSFIGIDNGICEKENSEWYGRPWVDVAHQRIANAAGDYITTEAERAKGQMALWDLGD